VICAKVARYAERVHHPDRLTKPLRRVGEKGAGDFQAITWDAALDEVAEAFTRAEQRHGAEAVWPYFFAGTMGHVQRDGIERLRHAKGYSRQWSTICTMLAESGWFAGVGAKKGVDAREIRKAEVIVIWGGNPVNTQVNVMTHVAKARKERGAKLVVVDPYRTGTAERADLHLAVKPGTDGALAAAVIHCLVRDGRADRAYLARHTDWDAGAEAHFAGTTPEWAAEITGLSAEEIEAFARLYGATKRSYIRVGYGFSRSRNGAANVHAVSCLPAVTGAWQVEGGGALWGNGFIYKLDKTLIEGLDARDDAVRVLDQSRFGPVLTGDRRDLGDGPPVTGLLIQNTNPAVVCPETRKCLSGLARDDLFTCVHEQFMTETAALADIVLPATTFLEHDDYYTASGHTFLQAAKAVIEPLPDCRSNHEVICALAKRLGAEHPGFEMTAWELIEATFAASGHPPAEEVWRNQGHDCAEPFEAAHFLTGFPQPDKRFHFRADWAAVGRDHEGMPVLPGFWPSHDAGDAEHPFRLVAAPARAYLNTSFTETPGSREREGRPEVMIHPEALAGLGLADGERVRLGNRLGSVVLHARAFDGLQPDVAVVESIWPNAAFEEGLGINTLVSADAGAPRGGAVFHDTAVWVRPA
jgi:anaerobic selenocysteine-containing dehydrogenase